MTTAEQETPPVRLEFRDGQPRKAGMGIPDGALWPLASSPERARCAAQAVERYLHMARIIMTREAAGPEPETPSPPQALDLVCPSAAIQRRVDELDWLPRPHPVCQHKNPGSEQRKTAAVTGGPSQTGDESPEEALGLLESLQRETQVGDETRRADPARLALLAANAAFKGGRLGRELLNLSAFSGVGGSTAMPSWAAISRM